MSCVDSSASSAPNAYVAPIRLADFPGIGQALDFRIAESAEAVALRDLDSGTELTYGAVGVRLGAFHRLFDAHGLTRGASLATDLPNGPDLACLILASLHAGVRLALIEPQTPTDRLRYFFEMVEPQAAFLAERTGSEAFAPICLTVPSSEPGTDGPGRTAKSDGADEAIVIFSSGTTGAPKGIVHSHANIIAELDAMIDGYAFQKGESHYQLLTLAHVSGLYRSLLMPLLTGGTVNMRRKFVPQSFWTDVVDRKVGFVQLVPSHVALLNRAPDSPAGPLSLRFVGTASAYLPPKEQTNFEERFGVPILQGYGLTECTCGITLNSRDASVRRPGVTGLPLKVNRIMIVDNSGLEVETGEIGELWVRGPNVASRFLGAETPQFEDGWLKTGDMGRFEDDGNITLVGRRTNIINRGAYKIYTLEIEEAVSVLPGVREAAVISVPHPVLGQDAIAFVTADAPIDANALLGALRQKIASFKVPTEIIQIDSLPQNKMGKVVKDRLVEEYEARQAPGGGIAASAIVPRVREIVAGLFALEQAKVTEATCREDTPPWDSLGHIQVLASVEKAFGVRLTDEAALSAQSVGDVAELVARALRSNT